MQKLSAVSLAIFYTKCLSFSKEFSLNTCTRIIKNLFLVLIACIMCDKKKKKIYLWENRKNCKKKKGFVFSPDFFNHTSEVIWWEPELAFTVGEQIVNNISHADDTMFIIDTKSKLQELVDTSYGKSESICVNVNNIEYMIVRNWNG